MHTLKQSIKEQWSRYLLTFFGAVIFSSGVNFFIVPAGFYSGGAVGIAQVLRTLLIDYANIPFPSNVDVSGIIYFMINLPLLLLAFKEISRRFFSKTLLAVITQTTMLTLLPIPSAPILDDVLATCLTGAIVCGFGCGLTLKAGGSAGGTDILGMYLSRKFKSFSVGKIGISVNVIIYTACALLFDISIAIYSIIYSVFMNFVVDRVHSQNIMASAIIFTRSKNVDQIILKELTRGVTVLTGLGAYTKKEVRVLITAVSKYELASVRRIIHEADPQSFMISFDRVSISGNFEKHLD